ncbi:MAG: response regulator [Cyanobacteria bacterium P01_A01_bin.40]
MLPNSLLIIDDDRDFITLIDFVFKEDSNWEVLAETNGNQGVATAKLIQPDIILLDVVMPEIDGFAIYKLLKYNLLTCNILIIFVSAKAWIKEEVKSRIAEDVLVITKPFDILELHSQLDNQLDKLCNEQKIA